MENPILKLIADNQSLFDVLKKLLIDEFEVDYANKIDEKISNEELGAVLRARLSGMRVVDSVFRKISQLKSVPSQSEKINGAR